MGHTWGTLKVKGKYFPIFKNPHGNGPTNPDKKRKTAAQIKHTHTPEVWREKHTALLGQKKRRGTPTDLRCSTKLQQKLIQGRTQKYCVPRTRTLIHTIGPEAVVQGVHYFRASRALLSVVCTAHRAI